MQTASLEEDGARTALPGSALATAEADKFGKLSVDLPNSREVIDELASIDPIHALFVLRFADQELSNREHDKYQYGMLARMPSVEFYDAVVAALSSGPERSDALSAAADSLTETVDSGTVRVEGWLAHGAANTVELRIRSAIVEFTPASSVSAGKETLAAEPVALETYEIREVLGNSLVTLTEVYGRESTYVVTSIEYK